MDSKKFLFVAGAPRSGTTFLCNLLDGHPDFVVFPLEHATIEKFFWTPESKRPHYFHNDFVKKKNQGQQAILANRDFIDSYNRKITNEFKHNFHIAIDPQKYLKGYQGCLNANPSLRNVLESLMCGLAGSNEYIANKYDSAKYMVFKQPFYTEVFAGRITEQIPNAKFIHVLRNPLFRYASAKSRRRKGQKLGTIRSHRINSVDSIRGHIEIATASFEQAIKNIHLLTMDNYFLLNYEDLVSKRVVTLDWIFEWLNVLKVEGLETSRLGVPSQRNTSFNRNKVSGADKENNYEAITNSVERYLIEFYLSKSSMYGAFNIKKRSKQKAMMYWFLPGKYETFWSYALRVFNFKQAGPFMSESALKESLHDRLPKQALRGPVMTGGAV